MTEFTPEEIKTALRNPAGWPTLAHAALAYIEQLEARVEALTAELRKMERALRWIGYKSPMIDALPATMQKHARAILAELKGQGDE